MKKFRQEFNNRILKATYEAQKKYGFKIGTGEHATWNNEADGTKVSGYYRAYPKK